MWIWMFHTTIEVAPYGPRKGKGIMNGGGREEQLARSWKKGGTTGSWAIASAKESSLALAVADEGDRKNG